MSEAAAELIAAACALDAAAQPAEALEAAWRALDLTPDSREAKRLLAHLLRDSRLPVPPERRADLVLLLADPGVNPSAPAMAGWATLLQPGAPLASLAEDPEALAAWAEQDDLLLTLLDQSFVANHEAELILTRLRRWLLLSGRWREFPRLLAALGAQAGLNEGAWWIEADERARLETTADAAIAAAYATRAGPDGPGAPMADPVGRAVADQYRSWPYPAWSRPMPKPATTLPAVVEALDCGRPSGLPVAARILIAGCGTGHDAALHALTYPDARITAIDISETSLAYAAAQCARLGIEGIDFRLLELQAASSLGESFDYISCTGVLHHLADPEAGWAALAAVLKPGGVMRIMVYSKLARLRVRAAQSHIADLVGGPVDAERLRAVRRRVIAKGPGALLRSVDFYTLSGAHDLLLHRHEDPFDVPRIARGLERLGLELLAFKLPTRAHRARYRAAHPDDPCFRDIQAWAALEKTDPFLFSGMYNFWCRKPAAA